MSSFSFLRGVRIRESSGGGVELVNHFLDRGVGDVVEVSALRVGVADKTVQVLARAALPGQMRDAKEHEASGRDRGVSVSRHLLPLAPGQSFPEMYLNRAGFLAAPMLVTSPAGESIVESNRWPRTRRE